MAYRLGKSSNSVLATASSLVNNCSSPSIKGKVGIANCSMHRPIRPVKIVERIVDPTGKCVDMTVRINKKLVDDGHNTSSPSFAERERGET